MGFLPALLFLMEEEAGEGGFVPSAEPKSLLFLFTLLRSGAADGRLRSVVAECAF
jgi:hypothetical protein